MPTARYARPRSGWLKPHNSSAKLPSGIPNKVAWTSGAFDRALRSARPPKQSRRARRGRKAADALPERQMDISQPGSFDESRNATEGTRASSVPPVLRLSPPAIRSVSPRGAASEMCAVSAKPVAHVRLPGGGDFGQLRAGLQIRYLSPVHLLLEG